MPNPYENGIYIVLDENIVHRYLCHNNKLSALSDTTVVEEVLSMLATSTSLYEDICEYISSLSKLEDGENFGYISCKQVCDVINEALEVAVGILESGTENGSIMGGLLYADILNAVNIPDDGTANHLLQLMTNVNNALNAPLYFRKLLFHILHKCEQYDDVQKWFAECVLTATELFPQNNQIVYLNHPIDSTEIQLSKIYFFNRFDAYYTFILLHFTQLGKPICSCKCCGNFFVPKTKKSTLYCDGVITKDGKTCKQVAPKLMQKLRKQQDTILAEYDRVKNRNYKRFERGEWKLPEKRTEKDMSFEHYISWLKQAQEARKAYLQGTISREEFRRAIYEE